ncbi:MAG: hypothetical protein PHU85_08775 [Phycisphaerae bacterium]|nr:hypothetical protein [Phycisphaerae bacterium]
MVEYACGSAGDAGGGFAGLDRFGRVVDQKWTVDGDAVDEFRYGHDRDSNRTFRENTVARDANQTLDEWYVYDGLGRLILGAVTGTIEVGDTFYEFDSTGTTMGDGRGVVRG